MAPPYGRSHRLFWENKFIIIDVVDLNFYTDSAPLNFRFPYNKNAEFKIDSIEKLFLL
jgi:hypothetical protein